MHFKIIRALVESASSKTQVIVESHGYNEDIILQQHATWGCVWIPARKKGSLPQLPHIDVLDFEEVTSPSHDKPWLTDCTASIMGWHEASNDPLLLSIDDWRKQFD